MEVPTLITIQIRLDQEVELSDLIVQLRVSTGHKNPYYIYFPRTDANGYAELTRADFIGQFTDHYEIGLMDYAGAPRDANPVVVISLFDNTWHKQNRHLAMAGPLLKHEKTKWRSKQEQYDYMVCSRNKHFLCRPEKVDLHELSEIVLALSPA